MDRSSSVGDRPMEELVPHWQHITHDNQAMLERHVLFPDFKTAWAFMGQVAQLAEEMQHHPHWENVYNKVSIRLTTHDQGNQVTSLDVRMAKAINTLLENNRF